MKIELDKKTERRTNARLLALHDSYEESLKLYTEILIEDPRHQDDLFREMMEVKAAWLATISTRAQCAMATTMGRRELDRLLDNPIYTDASFKRLENYGHKVFSQTDEDGIIEEIFARIDTTNRHFIEVGVETGIECNTHYLLHKGWSGAWFEGSGDMARAAMDNFGYAIDAGKLAIMKDWVSAETVNEFVERLGFPTETDLLSIDIDGSDYWVWKALEVISPRVVVIEYNAQFAPPMLGVAPYDAMWRWEGSDYYGASLQSLTNLAATKGYQLVTCSMNGGNAFFVRKDLCGNAFPDPATAENLYQPARFELYRTGAFKYGHPAKAGPWLAI